MLITHDLGVVAETVHDVVVMYAGRIVEKGSVDDVLLAPKHPYTEGLLTSIPSKGMKGQRLNVIKGTVPNPLNMPKGCNFAPRCPYAFEPVHGSRPADRRGGSARRRVLAVHAGTGLWRAAANASSPAAGRGDGMTTATRVGGDGPAQRTAGDGPLLEVENLVKYYPIYGGLLRRKLGDVKAVDDVSFEVRRGEVFGLVGESGCGKSTLGKTLIRLQPATAGTAKLAGEDIFSKEGADLKRFRRRMQIIFQDPVGSLNPRMPISDIIGEGLVAQADSKNQWGTRKVRDKRVADFLEAVGLRRDYTRRYPHEFSGGQRQRIGIARALALDPEFVVCDEPVSALDVSIQSQILNLLLDLRREFNLTYLFIAHNLSVVQYISDRVGVMYLGKLVELADVNELYVRPRHPYTVALLCAVPDPDPQSPQEAARAQGRRPVAGCAALRLPLPHPLLAARAARQPRELRDRGSGVPGHRRWPSSGVPLGRTGPRERRHPGGPDGSGSGRSRGRRRARASSGSSGRPAGPAGPLGASLRAFGPRAPGGPAAGAAR